MRITPISLVCTAIMIGSAVYHNWGGGRKVAGHYLPPPSISRNHIAFVEGAEAEPPAWPTNIPPQPKVFFAAAKPYQPPPLPRLPRARIRLSSVTFAKTPEGAPITIVWNR